ncbi:MAG: hypothetical protein JNN12_01160 [Bacteroidetes Order II. Incertae sedis bacterium]|nr:hypothetical protein [Bacteroidetes Order II. bacterium]
MKKIVYSMLLCIFLYGYAQAQADRETVFTWNKDGYANSSVRIQVYEADVKATRGKTHVVVVQEIAENNGVSGLEDARYLATAIAEKYNLSVEAALFVHVIGAFTFEGGKGKKGFMFGTGYKRQENGRLTTPAWRLVSVEDLVEYTDRQYRLALAR